MTEIILVRHGEASASWQESTDPGLSELGERQAEECANLLLNINGINKYELVSSPLKRAIETGSKLEEKLKGNLNINSSFAEIPSPGISLEDRQAWLREIFNKKMNELILYSKLYDLMPNYENASKISDVCTTSTIPI